MTKSRSYTPRRKCISVPWVVAVKMLDCTVFQLWKFVQSNQLKPSSFNRDWFLATHWLSIYRFINRSSFTVISNNFVFLTSWVHIYRVSHPWVIQNVFYIWTVWWTNWEAFLDEVLNFWKTERKNISNSVRYENMKL